MNEERKYEVIKSLADHGYRNKKRAAIELGCSIRTINRLIKTYRTRGKEGFIHGNRGRKPVFTIPEDVKKTVILLYNTKYWDANFTHFAELLEKYENIKLSVSSVAKILESEYILSPKVRRNKRRRIKKLLEAEEKDVTNKHEKQLIHNNIIAVENAHSRRPRRAYFGEQIQMDATPFEWVPDQIWHLHLAVDDATSTITGAWFDMQETLNGYYHILHQMLTSYGIPVEIFADNRTVFNYKRKNSPSIDEDTQTQFGYACKQLGIKLETSSVPQAKGRVERYNQTLQSRLPVELRAAGITDIDSANEFLKSYLKELNAKFALQLDSNKSVFVEQPSEEKINQILAVLTSRVVDTGHCIRFKKQYFKLIDSQGKQVHYIKGTKVMVIQAFDKNLYCSVNDTEVYALEAIPKHALYSPEIDPAPTTPLQKKKPYIPPMSHPWKRESFRKYLLSRSYHSKESVDKVIP